MFEEMIFSSNRALFFSDDLHLLRFFTDR